MRASALSKAPFNTGNYHSAVVHSEQWPVLILTFPHDALISTRELSVKLLSDVAASMGVGHIDSLVRTWPHRLYNP